MDGAFVGGAYAGSDDATTVTGRHWSITVANDGNGGEASTPAVPLVFEDFDGFDSDGFFVIDGEDIEFES